jgi:hypothetical protein
MFMYYILPAALRYSLPQDIVRYFLLPNFLKYCILSVNLRYYILLSVLKKNTRILRAVLSHFFSGIIFFQLFLGITSFQLLLRHLFLSTVTLNDQTTTGVLYSASMICVLKTPVTVTNWLNHSAE